MKETQKTPFNPGTVSRPDPALLKYYLFASLFAGPAFPLVFLPLYFKYHTLRYHLDDEGISMAWGILFRREIHLTYRRIQDIHLTRNIIQRWLSLATVAVQTASGKAGPEMSIEGILESEALRDHLYMKMRGARDDAADGSRPEDADVTETSADEALHLLRDIRDRLAKQLSGETQ